MEKVIRKSALMVAIVLLMSILPLQAVFANGLGLNWTVKQVANDMYGLNVTYSNGLYVAACAGGGIRTSKDGVQWDTRETGSNVYLNSVAKGSKGYAAVGIGGAVYTSPDGTKWTKRNTNSSDNLSAVASSGKFYVAVGSQGAILTSADGVTWKKQKSGTTLPFNAVTFGKGKFVAVGGAYIYDNKQQHLVENQVVYTSMDGVKWQKQKSPSNTALRGITYTGSKFAAVGGSTAMTSNDAVSWKAATVKFKDYGTFSSIAWNGKTFCAVGFYGTAATSQDGLSWKVTDNKFTQNNLFGITYDGKKFITVGISGTVFTSTDGIKWSAPGSGMNIQNWPTQAVWGSGLYAGVSNSGSISTSSDGMNWTIRYDGTNDNYLVRAGRIIYTDSEFLAYGAGSLLLTSKDGLSWVKRDTGISEGLCSLTKGKDGFVALSYGNNIYTSKDGSQWTKAYTAEGYNTNVVYGNGIYMVVGDTENILVSADGATWTSQPTGAGGYIMAMGFGNGKFIGIVSNGSVIMSEDGINWTSQASGYEMSGRISWDGSQYVVFDMAGKIYTSADGKTWDKAELNNGYNATDLVSNEKQYMLLNYNGSIMISKK